MSNQDQNTTTEAGIDTELLPISRRKILQASGATLIAGGAFTSPAAADDNPINVSPSVIELEDGETGTFTVAIQGPPYGRTDVTVTGANANPESFQLTGDESSQTVTVGPVTQDETVTIEAVSRGKGKPTLPDKAAEKAKDIIEIKFPGKDDGGNGGDDGSGGIDG